ncbi:hypothetical protein JRO89_XS02G0261400 [Xanthoceras sorbifolium]|uniref:Uncharacterized protein n=1 Tax=Xanthoceras sorbifolium TaxID=99658 RepID=A0ABQ8IH14_9ROSI|nr:hypothetical protein JRO89_XS02G0261400 [Xanthoceras sorbifolium]
MTLFSNGKNLALLEILATSSSMLLDPLQRMEINTIRNISNTIKETKFCEKLGHLAWQCYTTKKLFLPSSAPTANLATTNNNSSYKWLLDFGPSHHVTSDIEYLDTIRGIANELALIGASIPNHYFITHTLNGVGLEFKVLAATVRARDTIISFDELHDKLVEYDAFLKREELGSTGNLSNIIVNAA